MPHEETVVRIALDITEMDKQALRRHRRERWLNLIVYQFVFWGMIGSALVIWLAAMVGVLKMLGWWQK